MINYKNIIILSLIVALIGCSSQPEDTKVSNEKKYDVKSETENSDNVITIRPSNATINSVINLKSNDRSVSTARIQWRVNNMIVESARTIRFTSDELRKGDIVKAVVTDDGKEYVSNEILIVNSPPSIQQARVVPAIPTASSRVTLNISAKDENNDSISFGYDWTLNGEFAGEEDYLDKELQRGDKITVKVTPFDREGPGKSITIKSIVGNSLPEISDGSHEYDGKYYRYQIAASDPDGDVLSFELKEGPEGMTVDPSSGLITWEVSPDDAGTYKFKVSVKDNHGAKILAPLTTSIRSR